MKYRQQLAKKKELGDMSMSSMSFNVPSVEEHMKSLSVKFITFSANDCGYSKSAYDLIVNWAHLFFLKAKDVANKENSSQRICK